MGKFWGYAGAFFAILLLALMAVGAREASTPEGQERAKSRNVIATCEADYKQMKDDPRVSRQELGIVYGLCERLTSDYRRKWGRSP